MYTKGERKKTCPICNKEYITHASYRKYCGDDCAKEAKRRSRIAYSDIYREKCKIIKRQKRAEKKRIQVSNFPDLEEVDRMARESGMTYGQYVAKYGL